MFRGTHLVSYVNAHQLSVIPETQHHAGAREFVSIVVELLLIAWFSTTWWYPTAVGNAIPSGTHRIRHRCWTCQTIWFSDPPRKEMLLNNPSWDSRHKWLVENSKSIGFLKTIDGEIAMFVVTGYIVVKVNKSLYAQAICKYLKTRSTSSFLSSQHGCICYQSYQSSEMKRLCLCISSIWTKQSLCTTRAPMSVSTRWTASTFVRVILSRRIRSSIGMICQDTTQDRINPRSELFVSNKERLMLISLMNSSASFLLYPSFPLILSSRKTI